MNTDRSGVARYHQADFVASFGRFERTSSGAYHQRVQIRDGSVSILSYPIQPEVR